MATNFELIKQIKAASPDAQIDGLNNAQLAQLARQLKAAKEPVKQEPVKQEPVKQEPVKQEPVKQEPVKQELRVADGRALTTRRGVRAPGDVVLPEYVQGGQQTLDSLEKKGVLEWV